MTNYKAAQKLGISYQEIGLISLGKGKLWRLPNESEGLSVERAVLEFFRKDGWQGSDSEGGLILNLIKAASFQELPLRNKMTYIEALYHQNVAFEEDRYTSEEMINSIRKSDLDQINKNIQVMFCDEEVVNELKTDWATITTTTSGSILDFFPKLEPQIMLKFYRSIGRERLAEIASLFANDPYEYRKGWPDLTLWNLDTNEVIFREVKAPGDKLRPSQKKLIQDIIVPLGYDVGIIDVKEIQ